jgi:hypothetical protein
MTVESPARKQHSAQIDSRDVGPIMGGSKPHQFRISCLCMHSTAWSYSLSAAVNDHDDHIWQAGRDSVQDEHEPC